MRFYNPGTQIQQMLPYTNTTKDPRDGSTISNHLLMAPERDYFELPDVITLVTPDGDAKIPVGFNRIVKAQFAERGVVMINPNAKHIIEDDNLAVDDDDAKEKGDRLWKVFLRAKASEWYELVAQAKAAGSVPRTATGLFKFALTQLHLVDPADTVDGIMQAQEGKQSNAELQAQIREQNATIAAMAEKVNQMAGAQSARAEQPHATQQAPPAAGRRG
jgi:hypothetical protein